ncbi:MAG: sensor histidine kinase [Acetatifactor sp.]
MKLWMRYFREKRTVLLLYFLTVLLFVAVGCLYHIENLGKLLYAFLLTFVLWGTVGIIQGIGYVKKSEKIEKAISLLEKNMNLPMEQLVAGGCNETDEDSERVKSLEDDLKRLLRLVCDGRSRERMLWEEQAAERKDYYMMWVHQIKTPIAALKLLLEGNDRQDKESFLMREELFKIEQYAEMALSFQRLESMASDMVLGECDLNTILKQAVRKYAVLFINKGLKLVLNETPVRVLTDEKWFSVCLEQILSNSIKYTEQGNITIACTEEEEQVLLQIKDTGIGIRQEDLPRIFEKGFTGYNGRMDKKATGIGLYLCKRICDQLGVGITVDSTVGVGTMVCFTFVKKRKTDKCCE